MPALPRIRPYITLLVAAMTSGTTLAAAPATRVADPWAAVPTWPAACYSSQDKFPDQVNAARQALKGERSRQEEINTRVSAQTGPSGSEDPMELARRMQEAMMKDPQHAAEQLQSMGATDPAATQQRALAANTRYEQVKAGDKNFATEYQTAKKAMLAPARTRMAALSKKAAPQLVHTEAGDVWPEWAYKEADPIMHDANTAYTAFCAQWFGSGGKVPAYLKQRKDFFVNERIPSLDKMDATVTSQEMLGHSTEGYRSLAAYDAADDYLGLAYDLFGLRAANASGCPSLAKCADEFGLIGQ